MIVDKSERWIGVKSLKISLVEIRRNMLPHVQWNQSLWSTFKQLANEPGYHDLSLS